MLRLRGAIRVAAFAGAGRRAGGGCREYLEEAWMQEPGRVRFLYQGILQVGVGFYHQQNGNWRGATGLLRNGTVRLKEFEPETLGIDVARLVRECEWGLEGLERL